MGIKRAHELRCSTVQIFSHNPRGWKTKEISDEDITLFKNLREEFDISPVYVHASYLINIASASNTLREKSIALLKEEMQRADLIGADFVVLHTGSAPDRYARQRAVMSLREVVDREYNAGLLIESTSGKRGDITSNIPEMAELINSTGSLISGICIDTCHLFTAGYDLSKDEVIDRLSEEIKKYIGEDKLKLIHLNDSKSECGSGIDRHEHIGMGKIGKKALKQFITHTTFRDIPIILETPKKTDAEDIENLKRVRRMIQR